MALEKTTRVDKIEIVESTYVQIRARTDIVEDGKTISSSFERRVICPGDDYNEEIEMVRKICQLVQTPEVVEAYMRALVENKISAA